MRKPVFRALQPGKMQTSLLSLEAGKSLAILEIRAIGIALSRQ